MKQFFLLTALCCLLGLMACSSDSSDNSSGTGADLNSPPPTITDTPPSSDNAEGGAIDIHDGVEGSADAAALPNPATPTDGEAGKSKPSDAEAKRPASDSDKPETLTSPPVAPTTDKPAIGTTVSTSLPSTTITTGSSSSTTDKTPPSKEGKTDDRSEPASAPSESETAAADPAKTEPTPLSATKEAPAGGKAGSAEAEGRATKWTKNVSSFPVQVQVAYAEQVFIAQGGEHPPFQTIYESEDGVNWEETVTFTDITSPYKSVVSFANKVYIQTGPPANKVYRRLAKGNWVEDHSNINFNAGGPRKNASGPYYTKTHMAATPDMAGATPLRFPVSEEFLSFTPTTVPYIFHDNQVYFLGNLALKAQPSKILLGLYKAPLGSVEFSRLALPSAEEAGANHYSQSIAYSKGSYLVAQNDVANDTGGVPSFGVRFQKSSDLKTWQPLPELERLVSAETPLHRLKNLIVLKNQFFILLDEGTSWTSLNCRILNSSDLVTFHETFVPNSSCDKVWLHHGKFIVIAKDLIQDKLVTISLNPN